jgi:hypothetical protein
LARTGVALELALVVSQALVALWFFRLFRPVDSFAAGSIAAFGMVNAVIVLCSAVMLGTAVELAHDGSFAFGGDQAATVQLLYAVSGGFWAAGGLFFGLWLIPMGWLVVRSRWMPAALGWVLMVGGAGYVLGSFLTYLAPGVLADLAVVPATVGEIWMVGYLLVRGVSRRALDPVSETPTIADALTSAR